jgi:hypothetical protein
MPAKSKQDLSDMLGGESAKPAIRRGQGLRLSTEAPPAESQDRENAASQSSDLAVSQSSESATSQKRTNAETQSGPKRVNRGYMLREDLIKAFKRLAVDEDRKLYEVMEEALEQYLARRGQA